MTVIVFLLDNTASAAQKSYVGISYIDFARQFVETFMKLRQRDAIAKNDKYMLMGFDDYPRNVKSGWKENQAQFIEQLRFLRPTGRNQFAEALFNAIRFVNLNRVQSGIENYGYGRYPHYCEPVVFVAVVDASNDSARKSFLQQSNKFPRLPASGAELTDEPYRWDHRLFVVYLNLPGHPSERVVQPVPLSSERKQAEIIVEKMNGKSFELKSHKFTNTIIENILQRIQQNGVFVEFKRVGPPPADHSNGDATAKPALDNWKSQIVQITRSPKPAAGVSTALTWPIPESFWPSIELSSLPARKVYPEICFRCEAVDHVKVTNIAVDKYDIEHCNLTQYIIDRKNPEECWQVFVMNSHKMPGIGLPFGYIKLSHNLQTVNLFIFPYNYPLLLSVIEQAKNREQQRSRDHKEKLDRYLNNIPLYYVTPLRKALPKNLVRHNWLDESMPKPSLYNPQLLSIHKRWQDEGKEMFEQICNIVANFINPKNAEATKIYTMMFGAYQYPMADVKRHADSLSVKSKKIGLLRNYKQINPMFPDCKIAVSTTRYVKNPSSKFHNPYDIERSEIVGQLEKMRVNLDLQIRNSSIAALGGGLPGQRLRLHNAEDLHALPITKMGDFQEYTRRLSEIGMAPLRELEQSAVRTHTFGNPFKLDKKSMTVDEVVEIPGANTNANNGQTPPTTSIQNGRSENAAKLRQWKRRYSSISSSRETTPEPEEKRPNLDVPHKSFKGVDNNEDCTERNSQIEDLSIITASDSSLSQINNIDIDIVEQNSDENSRLLIDEPNTNGVGQPSLNGQTQSKNTLQPDIIETNAKRKSKTPDPSTSNSGSSSCSSDEDSPNLNKNSTIFGDSEQPINLEFRRRPYPEAALSSVEDPPTLSKQEMIHKKFHLIRAIKHKNNLVRFDPVQECVRLINELSWQEQFDCLEYAYEQSRKFGLSVVANQLSLELKRVAKCIRIVKTVDSNKFVDSTY